LVVSFILLVCFLDNFDNGSHGNGPLLKLRIIHSPGSEFFSYPSLHG
jgi:hypothetical protein